MWRVGLAFIAMLALGSLTVMAMTVWRPLARVVRAMLLALVAMLGIGGLSLLSVGVTEDSWWAGILGGGIVLVALRVAWGLRRRTARRSAVEPHVVPRVASRDEPWERFEARLDWVGRQQSRRSRKAIAGFLAERESASLTSDQRSLLLSCEKRVPELIHTCLDRCRNASARERDRYMDETLARLDQIGAEAERARREVREADDRRLHVLHRYFDGVAPGPDDRPRKP